MTKRDTAIKLAGQGFFVFPLREKGKIPAIKGWQEKATRDPEEIHKMWSSVFGDEPRDLNIGIATEPSGLIVWDVDAKPDRDGFAALKAIEARYGPLPATMRVRTPSGGLHIYLRGTPIGSRVNFPAMGIDIRSRGGLVVAPGSETEAGFYEVTDTCSESA